MSTRVLVPQFELVGPPCTAEGCNGVLIDHVSTRTREAFLRCATCGQDTQRMPVEEKLNWTVRAIERALKGEKVS